MKCNVDQSLIKVNTASQNTTNGTRSKSMERTSKVASDGIILYHDGLFVDMVNESIEEDSNI